MKAKNIIGIVMSSATIAHAVEPAHDDPLTAVPLGDAEINGGFWCQRLGTHFQTTRWKLLVFKCASGEYSKGIKNALITLIGCGVPLICLADGTPAKLPEMYWADDSSGRPFSKDPSVICFGGEYLMYYSLPGPAGGMGGWSVGIARSRDLVNWEKAGAVKPAQECDAKGLAAPAAWVRDGKVHLFYQTYGNGPEDAICRAWSTDGLNFTRNPENPVFAPTGDWTVGRAIDAEVFPVGDKLFMWYATRDPKMEIQIQGVASAPLDSDYGKKQWTQLGDGPILKPELPWETKCIEAASVMERDGRLWMFYAGGDNNEPQQIGVASSTDGIHWKRLSDKPLVPNGPPGSWNSSESGHPGTLSDADGKTYLFFQGNNDKGKTWYLSKIRIEWKDGAPVVAE